MLRYLSAWVRVNENATTRDDNSEGEALGTPVRKPQPPLPGLYLLCASDGMPIAFELAPANAPERQVAAEMLARIELHGYTVPDDKGFAGEQFEALMGELGAIFLRPDSKDEPPRFGKLGSIRQWIESIIDTIRGQLSLERHGAH